METFPDPRTEYLAHSFVVRDLVGTYQNVTLFICHHCFKQVNDLIYIVVGLLTKTLRTLVLLLSKVWVKNLLNCHRKSGVLN